MKKLIYILLVTLVVVSACEKNDYPKFDTDYSAVNIWVGTETTKWDSTTYNYSYSLGLDSIMFYARTIGILQDTDRVFTIEMYDGDVDSVGNSCYFQMYEFKAGEYSKQFPIYFDKSKLSMSSTFAVTSGDLYLRVKENGAFSEGAGDYSTIHIVLKNSIAKPDTWDSADYPYFAYKSLFGNYSNVKYQFMIKELGYVDFLIMYNATTSYDETTNTISYNYAKFLASKIKLALQEYNEGPDGPLMDENGNEVTF